MEIIKGIQNSFESRREGQDFVNNALQTLRGMTKNQLVEQRNHWKNVQQSNRSLNENIYAKYFEASQWYEIIDCVLNEFIAIELNKKEAVESLVRAHIRYERENYFGAIADLEEELKNVPLDFNPGIELLMAESYLKLKNFVKANEIVERVNLVYPIRGSVFLLRGKINFESKKNKLGKEDFEMAIAWDPKLGEAYYFLGEISLKAKKKKEANQYFEKAAGLGNVEASKVLKNKKGKSNYQWVEELVETLTRKPELGNKLDTDLKEELIKKLRQRGIKMSDSILRVNLSRIGYAKKKHTEEVETPRRIRMKK